MLVTTPKVCPFQEQRERLVSGSGPTLSVYTITDGFAASTRRTSILSFSSHTIGPAELTEHPTQSSI